MSKIDRERNILSIAEKNLRDIYGDFRIDSGQLDKPDAAIHLVERNVSIGIEITCVDNEKDQEYLNNEKDERAVNVQQVDELSRSGAHSKKPNKKQDIKFTRDYIFDGVIGKAKKYQSYVESGQYEEMIILAFSSHFDPDSQHFNKYHHPWTSFLLAAKDFPFDKVIFVGERTRNTAVVYDKKFPVKESPREDPEKEVGVTVVKGPVFPVNKSVNFLDLFSEEPHVQPRDKSKRKYKK